MTIFKVIDEGDGREYFCEDRDAVIALISNITELPRDDEAVIEAAHGGRGFQVTEEPLYD